MLTRIAGLTLSIVLFGTGAMAQEMQVAKNASCGCCAAWMERMQAQGFDVSAQNMDYDTLYQLKAAVGVPEDMMGCHTAVVGGYVIEGHVPSAEIRRLIQEAPEAVGLAVPGMPAGAPGMDYGSQSEAFDVYLIAADGTTSLYATYPAE